ncbi:hypothetical protein Pmar_PMAR008228 [Perkinsus marinus ATCC 50983]|uniref:Uncharacterized protein n=1 Tax=Perkinsus marinus (strain ATCC 50983 / TXsc) TaxID=423536 RepID=C5LNM8_PERM5|nr:hypothetical protein Pmar_PMAR008228 [Perkinsus marinus ATCC 50983]EER01647.1 hypothetical protein Pmar_PMAR008228 [Perkinsus marinus ATCC 50983]|eukprot:XP_002768929.1 hypothetical protein Pmar_PMAR008228 [Perkinsus marinus ATCC 50983]
MTSEQHPAIDSVQPSDVPDVSRSPPEANMDKTDMLEDLAERVAGMASVFAEANVAREKEREALREKHVQVLTCIEETKNDVVAETTRLRKTIDSYEAKSEHDLKRLEQEMRTLLETKHSEAMARIGELEERAAEVEKALVEEIENRKRHTESVLGMLQQKVSGEEDGRC